MLHKTIKVLPPKNEDIIISRINNFTSPSGYNISNRKIEIANSDKIMLSFDFFDKNTYQNVSLDYPNLWVQIDLLDENLNLYKPNIAQVKERAIIIKKNIINLKKFNLGVLLKKQEKVLDQALIFIV